MLSQAGGNGMVASCFHIDHNHDNNPGDGNNWELLCSYRHDEEDSKFESYVRYDSAGTAEVEPAAHNPFANLKAQMEGKD